MDNEPYSILPTRVRHDKRLKPLAKLLYSEILALSNGCGYAYPTNSKLAELYNVSARTISQNLASLEEFKYIRIDIKKDSKGTYRKIFPLRGVEINFQRGRNKFPTGMKDTSNGVEINFHTKEYYNNNTINEYYKKNKSVLEEKQENEQLEPSSVPPTFEQLNISPNFPQSFTSELIEACKAFFEMRKNKGYPFSNVHAMQAWVMSIQAKVKAESEEEVISAIYEAVSNKWNSIYIKKQKTKDHEQKTFNLQDAFKRIDDITG